MKKIIFLLMAVVGSLSVRADSIFNSPTTEEDIVREIDLLLHKQGWTVLHDAAYKGDAELMREALEELRQAGASPQEMNPLIIKSWTPLDSVIFRGYVEIVQLVLEALQKADVSHQENIAIVQSMLWALQQGDIPFQEMNSLASNDWTLLYADILRGYSEIVKLILEALQQNDISTQKDIEIVEFLLESLQEVDTSAQEMSSLLDYRWTPLHIASFFGHLEVVQALLSVLNAEQIMLTNEHGDTALELIRNENCLRGAEVQAAIEARLEELKVENETAL